MGCVRPRWEWTGNPTGGRFVWACSEWGKIFLHLSPEIWEKGIWGRERCEQKRSGKKIQNTYKEDTEQRGTPDKGLKMLGEEVDVSLGTP